METYNFPVRKAEILVGGQPIVGKKAVYRTDTKQVLGIVSNRYELIKHANVVDTFRKALKGEKFKEKIQTTKNGAHLFATFTFKSHQLEPKKGDVIGLQLIVKNSYDGSNTLQISLGALRLACLNGMVIHRRFFGYSQKHVAGAGTSLDLAKIKDCVQQMFGDFHLKLDLIHMMTERKIKDGEVSFESYESIFAGKAKLPDYLLEEAGKEYKKAGDDTVWGYYNALTFAITHKGESKNPQRAIEYGRVAWFAANQLMK